LAVTPQTHGKDPIETSPSVGNSKGTAGVDPRSDSLSRAYRIIVRRAKAEEPSVFYLAVTNVFGLFCNASAKYAHMLTATAVRVERRGGDVEIASPPGLTASFELEPTTDLVPLLAKV
jgi:hypothetical protein